MNTTTCEPIENFLDPQCNRHGDTTAFIFFLLHEAGLVRNADDYKYEFTELGREYFLNQWEAADSHSSRWLTSKAQVLREAAMALLDEADRCEQRADSSAAAE